LTSSRLQAHRIGNRWARCVAPALESGTLEAAAGPQCRWSCISTLGPPRSASALVGDPAARLGDGGCAAGYRMAWPSGGRPPYVARAWFVTALHAEAAPRANLRGRAVPASPSLAGSTSSHA